MYPSFSFFGFLDIYLLPIFLILAAFFGAFIFYRLLHKNARHNEFEVFDGFLLSLACGFVLGRLFYITLNFPQFGFNLWTWLNFLSYPGIAVFIAIFGSSICFWLWLVRHKIPDLELLDYWSRATTLGLVFYNLGLFLDGSGAGHLTTSPFAIRFPGVSALVHPAQLYAVAFYLVLFFLLASLERNYRTYNWYRGSRSQARTGFVFCIFLICSSLYSLFALTFQPSHYIINGFLLDWIFYLIILLIGLIILYHNSFHIKKKKH